MRILILTQYFPPETGAPQNRLFELAVRLRANGIQVEVLTALPNYPEMKIFPAYLGKKYVKEEMSGITVHRTTIYVAQSKSIVKRLLNYFSFVRSSWKRGKKFEKFDFVLCESPPLFLGYTAMKLSRKLNAKLIFNVSDLWPESAVKLGIVTNKFLLKMAYRLEAKIYRRSFLITGQTQGIVSDIKKRFPEKDVYWLPNGVDLKRYDPTTVKGCGFRQKNGIAPDDLVFFYGGIIGHAQGLEVILSAAEKFLNEKKVHFVIMGSGPLKNELKAIAERKALHNVLFADPVGRTEIGSIISEMDASIIPLKKIDLFTGAIPSKIFEVLAMEKPILLGVDGEARSLFIDQGNSGWFFEPENTEELCKCIREIVINPELLRTKGQNGRNFVAQKFNRDKIAQAFIEELHKLTKDVNSTTHKQNGI